MLRLDGGSFDIALISSWQHYFVLPCSPGGKERKKGEKYINLQQEGREKSFFHSTLETIKKGGSRREKWGRRERGGGESFPLGSF